MDMHRGGANEVEGKWRRLTSTFAPSAGTMQAWRGHIRMAHRPTPSTENPALTGVPNKPLGDQLPASTCNVENPALTKPNVPTSPQEPFPLGPQPLQEVLQLFGLKAAGAVVEDLSQGDTMDRCGYAPKIG